MATTQTSKISRQARLRRILSGIDKHFANVGSITLAGTSYTPADLKKILQADIDVSDASVKAKAAWQSDVQLERNSHAKVNPVIRMIRYYVLTQFGETKDATDELADFGFSPRKSTKKTSATTTEAVAQAKATRTARNTMGKRQKAKVKGTVSKTPATGSPPAPV